MADDPFADVLADLGPEPAPNGAGHWREEETAPPPKPKARGAEPEQPPTFAALPLAEFCRINFAPREYVLAPVLPERGLAMLYAGRGIGKTRVGMGLSYAAASGGDFLRWRAAKPRRVLYVDGEMPAEMMKERALAMMAAAPHRPPDEEFFRLLAMDLQGLGTSINLARPEHQAAVEDRLEGAEFLVLDNLSTLVNGGRENDAESWDGMQSWLLHLRRRGVSVLLVHHAGRSDNARGTSKREDVLDTVIYLRRPDDYDAEEGARFEVHITKGRGIFGDDALPFEAQLHVIDGRDDWTITTLRDREQEQVLDLTRDGMTVRDIAAETGLSKSRINRRQAKLRAEGRL
jgi:putative DNA primase/helicase